MSEPHDHNEIDCYAEWQNWNVARDMQLERAIVAEMKLAAINAILYPDAGDEIEHAPQHVSTCATCGRPIETQQ